MIDLLTRAGHVVSCSKNLECMLVATVELVCEVLGVNRASVMLLDPVSNVLRLKAAAGITAGEWDKVRVKAGDGVSGHVVKTRVPLLVEDISASEFAPLVQSDRYSTSSFLSVPLSVKGHPIGVVNATEPTDARVFDSDDLDLLTALSAFVAGAIDNSRLISVSDTICTQLESIVESLPQAVFSLNLDGKVTLCNLRFVRLLGLNADSPAEGRRIEELVPAPLLNVLSVMQRETLTHGAEVRRESELALNGAAATPFEIVMTPLTIDSGAVGGVLATMQDLTMRKEIAELRRLDELKSRFLSLISHELRTPLTSIKGAVHILMHPSGGQAAEPTASLAGIIHKNTERLIRLVNDLLEMVNIENQNLTIMPARENLTALVEKCIEKERPVAEGKGVYLHSNFEEVTAKVDRVRICQALGYLLDNALKFTPRGGHVRVALEQADDRAFISVEDTGCGISAEAQEKVFGKFYQAQDPLTRSCGGTGVGLFLARTIVEMHGGRISVNSQPNGEGSRFTIELPIHDGIALANSSGVAGA